MTRPIHPLMRVPVPWVFALAYLIGAGLQLLLPHPQPAPRIARLLQWAGVVLLVAGGALAGWSLSIFRRARTTTVPFENAARLVTWGPYRFSRNPMYASLTLLYLGQAALLGQAWPIVPLLLTLAYVNGVVIPHEESRLSDLFGDAYAQYCSRVARWISFGP